MDGTGGGRYSAQMEGLHAGDAHTHSHQTTGLPRLSRYLSAAELIDRTMTTLGSQRLGLDACSHLFSAGKTSAWLTTSGATCGYLTFWSAVRIQIVREKARM